MVLINLNKEIGYFPLKGLILNRIPALIYYVVYYDLTHSSFHILSFSILICIISSCLFEKVLLIAPLIGL